METAQIMMKVVRIRRVYQIDSYTWRLPHSSARGSTGGSLSEARLNGDVKDGDGSCCAGSTIGRGTALVEGSHADTYTMTCT